MKNNQQSIGVTQADHGRMLYRYVIHGRRGIVNPVVAKQLGIPEVIENLPEWNVENGHIAPESVEAWYSIFDAIDRGEKYGSQEIVFRFRGGMTLRRNRVDFTGISDERGVPTAALVTYEDITDQYERDRAQSLDRDRLLQVAQMAFPEILFINLTKGTCRLVQGQVAKSIGMPTEGPLDDMLGLYLSGIFPEDLQAFKDTFFRDGLAKAIEQGKEKIQLTYRRTGLDGALHWIGTAVMCQENPYDEDILLVAVSRNIDEEKGRELRLRDQLRQQEEELALTMNRMGKHISYYDVSTSTLTTSPAAAKELGIPPVMENYPECFIDNLPAGYLPNTAETLRSFIGAIHRGDPSGYYEYSIVAADGRKTWFRREFVTIFDDGNQPVRAVISSEDITASHIREAENRQLKEQAQKNEHIFQIISQHSNRILYAYDLTARTTRPWDAENEKKDILAHMYTGVYSDDALDFNPYVLPDCVDEVKRFFADIHGDVPAGEVNVHIKLMDGQLKWYHFNYSRLFDGGQPAEVLISIEDITERYEHDHQQLLDRSGLLRVAQLVFPEILSSNLTRGTCTVIQSVLETPKGISLDQFLLSRLEDIAPEDQETFRNQFFRSNQLKAIRAGKERFQLTYRRRGTDGVWHWIETIVVRHENPYNDDILTFAVSRNVDQLKAQEELLQQSLADSTEKLEGWLYYNSLSSQSFPGLVYVNYLDGRLSPYIVGTLAKRLDCSPKELAMSTCFRIPNEDKGALQLAYEKAKQFGEKSFQAEYRVETDRGEIAWVYNHAIYFEDKDGGVGYIHFLTDTTHEHTLMEQVRLYMEEKLAENEKIFGIAFQHSDRTLCYYDIKTRSARPWNEGDCETCDMTHMCFKKFSLEQFERGDNILPDSQEEAARMVREIHAGTPFGKSNIHIAMPDGRQRWLEFKYSGLLDGETPVAALISYKDVTERHENEMSHLRFVRSMGEGAAEHLGYLEADLITDYIEKHTGTNYLNLASFKGKSYTSYWQNGFVGLASEQRADAKALYAKENLIEQCRQGVQNLDNIWKVERDGTRMWVRIIVELMEDSFSGHIKMFGRMTDVTSEYEERIAVNMRADYDAMTGLLRRDVGEALIRKHLSSQTEPGGILVALDLDDLKGINDTLGHAYGDRAIVGVADTLKSHFRKDDILIRAGGDEFMVFLPGAGKSVSSVKLSLTALLRKLSAISIGDHNERTIHCSIGCAVELPDTDTFDSLYQRADMALYHVKRSGKNNFVFFESAMLEDNYRFKIKQAQPIINDLAKEKELKHLLEVVSIYYPGVVLFNLTQNYFCILTVGSNVEDVHAPDRVDVFWENWRENIHPDDQENILSALSRNRLLAHYTQGQRCIRRYYRNLESIGYVRTEVVVQLYTTDDGDICAFLFFRWETTPEKDMEIQRLSKIVELSGKRDFEYICRINVRDKSYSTFSRDGGNSHMIPEAADFDTVTRHIRDTQIPPEERDAYYEQAALDHVLQQMRGAEGSYSYRYTLIDGAVREAVFNWYEDSHTELLMTVRRIT